MRTELVADALRNAAATTLIEPDAIWHSDRGSVYTSAEFRALVTGLGMRSSMGRTGVCWDQHIPTRRTGATNKRYSPVVMGN